MYIGKMISGAANVYPYGIQDFIDRGFQKFLDEDFNKRTGIRMAILWYNLGRDYNIGAITFGSHFIALEILAERYAKENPIKKQMTDADYSIFKKELKVLLQKLDMEKWGKLHSNICKEVQRVSINNKISALLEHFILSQYGKDAKDFVEVRNKIFHEGQDNIVEVYGGWCIVLMKIERLLVKLILKTLDCYNMDDSLHVSIQKDDLLARS